MLGDWGIMVGERGRLTEMVLLERGIGEEFVSEKEEEQMIGGWGKEEEVGADPELEKEELETPTMLGRENFGPFFFLGEVILSMKGKEGEEGKREVGREVGERGGEDWGEEGGELKEEVLEECWGRVSNESREVPFSGPKESRSGDKEVVFLT